MTEIPPRCWNRPPREPSVVRITATGERVEMSNAWFTDRCATWDGVGIGQPTPEYPTGTPYPVAHGWEPWCRSCRWNPVIDTSTTAAQHTGLTPTMEPA